MSSSSGITQAEVTDFSIIVPAFNEEDYLPKTLRSLNACMDLIEDAKGEIIVVDNNSNDQTAFIAKSNGVRVVHEKNRGIARARNSGAEHARGHIFFFVDADTFILPSLFQEAYHLSRHGRVGAGGSTLRFDRTHGKLFFGLLVPKFWNLISQIFRLAAGSFVFCRKELFVECGGFPENFYAGEEVFFSRKVKESCSRAGREFRILGGDRVVTSSRKLLWHSNLRISLSMTLLLLFPLALRYRKLCHFWYERPEEK